MRPTAAWALCSAPLGDALWVNTRCLAAISVVFLLSKMLFINVAPLSGKDTLSASKTIKAALTDWRRVLLYSSESELS